MVKKGKKLLIVESPTKARTITRMVGSDFNIMASMGHIRDLPERELGVDIEHGFAPQYVASGRGNKVVSELKAAARNADEIYLAPDPDREGEAIAWHLQEVLGSDFKGDFKRVTFHEITRSAILKALENYGSVNMDLVDAQQARRVLDRIVGYRISPLLWSRVAKGSSAGRVQSVALRLIVEREREIEAFKPVEYWVFKLKLMSESGVEFYAKFAKIDGKTIKVGDEKSAAELLDAVLNHRSCKVGDIEKSKRYRNAPPPFTTSTLQQTANQMLRFSASGTMRVAQSLYEGIELGSRGAVGLITYMRTDSVNIAAEARSAAAEFIRSNYGAEFVPAKPNFFKSKNGAQEAHEAIRPTDVTRTPESVKEFLDAQQYKLYSLIWKRFVASQMTRAEFAQLNVQVNIEGADSRRYDFRAAASSVVFPGFMKVMGAAQTVENEDENTAVDLSGALAKLKDNEACRIIEALKEQKFTEPPPRFTEATLIKELEENGIGRPSTYATILQTIQSRKYTSRLQNKLIPTELGCKVTDFLVQMLPELFDVKFTSRMEGELDAVEGGERKWTEMMEEFYGNFQQWLAAARDFGSVEGSKLSILTDAMQNIEFAPAEKTGRFVRDDKKFFKSIAGKLVKQSKLSEKQFNALLDLALQYADQLPDLQKLAAEGGFTQELAAAFERAEVKKIKDAEAVSRGVDPAAMSKLFAAFDQVKFAEPTVRRGRTYDDKKFFDSLRQQAESGKILSDKQLEALGKIALRYRDDITDYAAVATALNLPDENELAAEEKSSSAAHDEAGKLISMLANVTEWAPAERKGRRTYDDKSFYTSLAEQFNNGKNLSEKQLAALKKLAAKYADK
ncbi:MAG: type I DNA topoisomerase [Lentisphaerae bacterium]|nr:type I DNA topoisomerase [Lentisphaerota bacterium]